MSGQSKLPRKHANHTSSCIDMASSSTCRCLGAIPCVICGIACSSTGGVVSLCSSCAADFMRRKERIIDRVHRSTKVNGASQYREAANHDSRYIIPKHVSSTIPSRLWVRQKKLEGSERKWQKYTQSINYAVPRKSRLESNNRRSWNYKAMKHTTNVQTETKPETNNAPRSSLFSKSFRALWQFFLGL